MQHDKILILDFGSQVTQLIARRVREAHVLSEVHPCDVTDEAGMAHVLAEIEDRAGPVMLAIFNAGILLPVYGEEMDMASFRNSYEVNVFGVLNGLVPAVRRMHAPPLHSR